MSLKDDFLKGAKGNFYVSSRNQKELVQLIDFGSLNCPVLIFDKEAGKYIRTSVIRTEESGSYVQAKNLPFL